MAAQGHRKWPGAALTIIFAAAYAALALASGLDRVAAYYPGLDRYVLEPFRVQSLAREARRYLAAGIAYSALASTERLISLNPTGPESTALLGAARMARGDNAGAERAFRVSAQHGWREPATQIYWLRAALAGGDYTLAATRFSALARQWPRAPEISQLSAVFEADPRGRAALSRRIADGETWALTYADPGQNEPSERLASRAEVLVAAGTLGRKLGCEGVARMARSLAPSQPLVAATLWRAHCPSAAAFGAVADSGFEQATSSSPMAPFAWNLPGDGALEVSFVPGAGGGQALSLRSSAAQILPVAVQMIPLRPGHYRLSWRSDAADAQSAAHVLASLSCRVERQQADPRPAVLAGGTQSSRLDFSGACAAPWLQLWLVPGSQAIIIDDVVLTRL